MLIDNELTWWPELGFGWYPVTESPYDAAYFAKYRKMDATDMGKRLTESRIDLVRRHYGGVCCDVGVGGGRFVADSGSFGYDINPDAVAWLADQGSFADPYAREFRALTFWDSLEHIPDIRAILTRAGAFVFVSIPIFSGPEHVLMSKHYRKDEHCWYFTRRGFVDFMGREGFDLLECSVMEQQLGREGIESFAFARRVS